MIPADVQVFHQRRQRARGHLGDRVSCHGQMLKRRIVLDKKKQEHDVAHDAKFYVNFFLSYRDG